MQDLETVWVGAVMLIVEPAGTSVTYKNKFPPSASLTLSPEVETTGATCVVILLEPEVDIGCNERGCHVFVQLIKGYLCKTILHLGFLKLHRDR